MRQQAERPSDLAAAAGARLKRAYRMSSGGGVPWVVDEHASWYKPHERARYSCVNCSGDVVPEKDLVGCWPLWPQFGPDELEFRCVRRWTSDPGEQAPHKYMQGRAPLPCWRTCWTPLKSPGAERCTAACPSAESAEPAVEWRARWDAELHSFKERDGTARDVERATGFIRRLPNSDFFWSVY
ncbi:hypothetical protein EMIHUDRAFT_465297 [Emiliania huxleyi CCMP1516]|uniref:Uncharacterized protein n=3 Tax=Emiliania huxleyi TaxID=2903 RepID=A0A0D3IGA7_EMIH1|nr:hypothetical protein EMIHUDRAFT_465297 [Emiliania huxleyi CCMP1516]EOD10292.1 hypothetical protein EMIHUDRAFT_465297 [Emiliania huxleyi CCMP1516]|eukprot:XP_005762721.1 hypothetical protein EMIHUDRAFT_465297 [Emiliania huxleyi CCMP1516]